MANSDNKQEAAQLGSEDEFGQIEREIIAFKLWCGPKALQNLERSLFVCCET
jgi:hypothetical protein